jgi:hypothetical protein
MGFLSDIFNPNADRLNAADAAGEVGRIEGGSFSGPGGVSGGFDFTNNRGSSNFGLGSFQSQLDNFQNLQQQGMNQAGSNLPPELQALGQQTIGNLGNSEFNRLGNQSNFNGLGDIFNQSVETAGADPFELGAGVAEKLRSISERRNQRNMNSMFDRLKRSGKLGTSGGASMAAELDANEREQGMKFDLAGLDAGRGLQSDAISRMFGAMQGREQIGARQFGEDMGQNQFNNNASLQQFGVGSDMFRQFLANQSQGANLAMMGAQGAQGTAQIPLAFQQAMLAAQGQASNSNFAQQSGLLNSATQTQSGLLNALTTAGSLAGAIAPGGFMGRAVTAGTE